MDTKDEVLENEQNNEPIPQNSKGELNVKGSEFAIEQMLYILGEYTLAPTPLPSDLISLWSRSRADKSQPCDYCSYKNSKFNFPRVEVDLKRKKIKFISLQRACQRCYSVIDLKGLLNLIKEALLGNKDRFDIIYNHFLLVNKLKENYKNELNDETSSNLNSEKDVIFQDLVSMAYSLNIIMSDIDWEYCKE